MTNVVYILALSPRLWLIVNLNRKNSALRNTINVARQKAIEEQEAAIKAAVDKATSEYAALHLRYMRNFPSSML